MVLFGRSGLGKSTLLPDDEGIQSRAPHRIGPRHVPSLGQGSNMRQGLCLLLIGV
jgi:ABC-type lipoprotein export system ATPase subunit